MAEMGRQWLVHLDGKTGQIEAQGHSAEWRLDNAYDLLKFYGRLPGETTPSATALLHEWKTHFTWQASSMTFYHAATLNGGQTEIKGNVRTGSAEAVLNLSGAAQDLPLAALVPMTGSTAFDGKLTGIVTDFSLSLSSRSWSSLSARGSTEIQTGRFQFPAATLKSLARAHTMAYMKAKFPGFEQQGLSFAKISGHWQAAGGQITLQDGLLEAAGLKAALVGKIDAVRRGIDATLRLQLREKSPNLMKLIPGKYIYGPAGHEEIQPIYGRLQGAWNEWTLRALPSGKIPAAVQSRLKRGLR